MTSTCVSQNVQSMNCVTEERGGQQVRRIDDINLCMTECSINELCDGRKRWATSTLDR